MARAILTALALVAVAGLASATAAEAFNPQPEPPAFGMLGIVQGQTARLSVVNIHPPEPGAPSCRVGLGFVDAEGGLLLPAVQVTLRPGQAAFADLDLRAFDVAEGVRVQVRPVFVPPVDPDRPRGRLRRACDDVLATLEVFDTRTGQSLLLLNPAVIRGFNPQPEPPASGAAPGR